MMRNITKKIFLFYSVLIICSPFVRAAEVLVSSPGELTTAVSAAQPGDTIVMKDGSWTDIRIIFEAHGTEELPVVLRAQTPGHVIINGLSYLRISGEYLIVDGLNFNGGYCTSGSVIEFRNGSSKPAYNCRLTNTAVINYNPPNDYTDYKWVSLYGQNNRVDHCYLAGKNHSGTTLVVWLSSEPNYHQIDSNYFAYRPELGQNGGETIRIGTSDWSMWDSYTTVEHNYFERCNGETEIISNKSGHNTFRYNTFYESEGTLTLRHGNYAEVYGNFFIGNNKSNTGGVRIIGENHKVFNNYFENLRGSGYRSALVIMNGVPNSPLNRYFQVKNAQVAFNTFINCSNTFVIGAGKSSELSLPPEDCTIANNAVLAEYEIIDEVDEPVNLTWQGNIFYGAPLGIDQPEGITLEDPQLIFAEDSLRRPADSSPLLNAAEGSYTFVTDDIDGQLRSGSFDVGSDEKSTLPVVNRPLTGTDVGPLWFPLPLEPAKVIYVEAGEDSLKNALAKAERGNIIELVTDGGDYPVTSNLKINFPVIIRAAEGLTNKPVIKHVNASTSTRIIFEIVEGGELTLEGLELDGLAGSSTPAKYLIRTDDDPMTEPYKLFINNCYLHDVKIEDDGNFFRAYEGTFADTIIIKNSLFSNCGKEGIRLKDEPGNSGNYSVAYFEIGNSTFWNTSKEAINIYGGDQVPFTPGPVVSVNHVTFNNCGFDNAPAAVFNEVDDTKIANSIISNSSGYTPSVKLYGLTSEILYTNLYNTGGIELERNAQSSYLFNYNPQYENSEAGNFTLPGSSPMQRRANDGEALGDLNWAVNPATVYPLDIWVTGSGSVSVEPENEGMVYSPGTEVTITAVPAEGYKFDEWEGSVSGSDSIIQVTMNSSQSLGAFFSEAPTSVEENTIPSDFSLEQNYPNPFNPETVISYSIAEASNVSIKIYDTNGSLLETLVDEDKAPGNYKIKWNGEKYSSGIYLIIMNAAGKIYNRKALLLK